MTESVSFDFSKLWDFAPATPYPHQDTDLLQQFFFLPGLREILMLRQVHALEHGTVWVLSETEGTQGKQSQDNQALGGLSTDQGFYLYGEVNPVDLRRAVQMALKRMQGGEWDLAVHPRCGTNVSVMMMVGAGMMLGTYFLLPRNPIEQVLGLGLASLTAVHISPDLGRLAQKYLTTAIPFNLTLQEIFPTMDMWGREAHFVRLGWQEWV
ncbi:DUF6391 domain-containing protein [Spirulina subsalsa]|uniref:DUF6391 domain-containing protein n=1 Tax=Spirulina subsalsa TaxID=54311 RepID=UPI00030AAF9F|nr:DUF6391 domain-containing protein [Spirulina subsalsa]